jgi:hypothetical protein
LISDYIYTLKKYCSHPSFFFLFFFGFFWDHSTHVPDWNWDCK